MYKDITVFAKIAVGYSYKLAAILLIIAIFIVYVFLDLVFFF